LRVAVCCKGVPVDMVLESVELANGDMRIRDTDLYINEVDDYAIEAALALKQSYGAETFALSVGTLKTQEVLYYAVAKGVGQAIRIEGESSRPELVASALLPALQEITLDLVLVGVQSEDWGGGEVGIYVAQALAWGVAYAVTEIVEVDKQAARVKKELGNGKMAEVRVKLPAVLCVQTGIQPLQYLSAVKRRKARTTSIQPGGKLKRESIAEKIPGITAYQFEEVRETPREGQAEILSGTRSEQAAKLLRIIRGSV
jgi:electron transfer flavoprotein beta subunit